jgi:tRNA-dihydrouridine synthase B
MKPSLFVKRLRETRLMLPPLTGFTDYPYRTILAEFNPPFLTTEMVNARALLHQNPRTVQMIKRVTGSLVQGVQILGKDPASMAQAAKMVENLGFDYVDINMGCTIKKVTSRGEGVALMNDEQRACDVVKAVSDAVDLPVTVKLRIGSSKKAITALSLSQKLVAAGAVALTVHGRTGEKKFSSPIDLSTISDVVKRVSVPVIANGGIFTGEDAKTVLIQTGAAAVMPGRGLMGNPWLVSEICCAFSGKAFSLPTLKEKKKICAKHAQELCNHYGERRGVLHMRKILPKYFPSTLYLKELKHDVQHITTKSDIEMILERIKERDLQWCYIGNTKRK